MILGSVAIIELTKAVSESIPESEVADIQNEVADAYGVEAEDVTVEVIYETTGSINHDPSDGVSDEELAEALEDEIAGLLGIHEGNVHVDIVDGVAFYTITSDSAEAADAIQETLNAEDSRASLDDALGDSADILSIDVNDEITAEIIVTVDTGDASNNLNNAAAALEESFQQQGYGAEAESNYYVF